ncbi:MAG: hypothetical protein KDD51_01860 [Bdellovibrionales bacterium]|nr:hypothetical protein [Bdellovibrionales bacterium]
MKYSVTQKLAILMLVPALSFWTACTRSKQEPKAEAPAVESQAPAAQPHADAAPSSTPIQAAKVENPADGQASKKSDSAVNVVRRPSPLVPAPAVLKNAHPRKLEFAPMPIVGSSSMEASVPKTGMSFFVGAGHKFGTQASDRTFTEMQLQASYFFENGAEIGILQTAKKLYEIAPVGEKELLLDDTVFFWRSQAMTGPLGTTLKVTAGVTLPVSEQSGDRQTITRPSVALTASKKITETLELSVTPYVQYHFNRFVSGPDRVPSPLVAVGAITKAEFHVVPNTIKLVGWDRIGGQFYEQYDDRSVAPPASTLSNFGAYLDFLISDSLSLQAGWLRGNSLPNDGLNTGNQNFYDPESHRFYASIGIRF